MACFHPLKGFNVGLTENGKKDLVITPYDTECVFKPFGSDKWERHGHILDRLTAQGRVVTEFVPIPCGQCIGCRIDYSKQWANRCMLESEYHDENYFLTLTYDDEHVVHSGYYDCTGEFCDTLTLYKKDLQDFNKRLRINLVRKHEKSTDVSWTPEYRFYACGEYGSRTARPHYHMLAFGLHLDDLVFYKSTPYGNLYTSKFLTDTWNKGHVIIGSVAYESCAYVSRYIMKKQKGLNSSVYDLYGIAPEFVLMSRNPGIARDYFEDNYDDIYDIDKVVLQGGKICRPPRYFDKLMDDIDEDLMSDIKLSRIDIAEKIQKSKDLSTTANYQLQLEYAERNKEHSISKLVRTLD